MKCPDCKKSIPSGNTFCIYCGAKLQSFGATGGDRKKKFILVGAILAGVIVVGIVCCVLAFGNNKPPSGTLESTLTESSNSESEENSKNESDAEESTEDSGQDSSSEEQSEESSSEEETEEISETEEIEETTEQSETDKPKPTEAETPKQEVATDAPVVNTNWSAWSTTKPSSSYTVESKKEYRYRTVTEEIKQSTTPLSGYILINYENTYSAWKDDLYYTTTSKSTGELCKASDKQTGYKYAGWFYTGSSSWISKNIGYPSKNSAQQATGDRTNNWVYREIVVKNKQATTSETTYCFDSGKTPAGDAVSKGNVQFFNVVGKKYSLEYGQKTWYKYSTRSVTQKVYTYKRKVYSNWSAWSDTPVTSSQSKEVETRTVYRYK